MSKTNEEVADILLKLYDDSFGGAEKQRYLISWGDLKNIYGLKKLFNSRLNELIEAASNKKLYLFDLGEGDKGHLIGVIKIQTVDRWRRVPRKIIDSYSFSPDDEQVSEEDNE